MSGPGSHPGGPAAAVKETAMTQQNVQHHLAARASRARPASRSRRPSKRLSGRAVDKVGEMIPAS